MAIPRKAMQEMGFQSCCLLCDAKDVAGTKRCKACIDVHSKFRKDLENLGPENPLVQFALELMQMISNPHRWDHDEEHGAELQNLQVLIGSLAPPKKHTTSKDISNLFAEQASKKKKSVIQEVANRNPWKEAPPNAEQIQNFEENLPVISDSIPGVRTIPNKPIQKVDRSDRLGEDRKLTDIVTANAANDERIVEDREVARKDWNKALDLIGEILDDEAKEIDDDLDI